MINQLFTFSSTIERLCQGPLSEHLDAYAAAVADQGYTDHSISQQIVGIADFSRWLEQKHIAVQALDSNVVNRFLRHRRRPQRVRRGDPKTLQRLLTMLRQMGVVRHQPPVAETAQSRIVAEFRRYLLHERGLSPSTLLNYAPVAEQFLAERFHNRAPDFGSAYGLAFTASHNPPEWNGLKVFHGDGSLLLDHETRQIEAETNALTADQVIKLELDVALNAGIVTKSDFTNQYVDAVEALIDLQAIRNAGLKVIVDPMYGVGQLTLGTVLTEARCRVTFIHERHNPLFGGRSPAPNPEALRLLTSTMHEERYDLGLAMDGDADRIAIVDELGEYISENDVLLLLYWYVHEVRGERGGVVRNLSTTHLLDRLAHALHEESYEVPVGFKHIVSTMLEHDALLGGESSGGLTIRGHILGKDGIFASALVVEMLARTGKKISQLRQTIYGLTGRLYGAEDTWPATPEMRVALPRAMREAPGTHAASYPVVRVSHMDGTKLYLENDNWVLLRFSGTEPVLRLTVEADSPRKASELLDWLKQFAAACK